MTLARPNRTTLLAVLTLALAACTDGSPQNPVEPGQTDFLTVEPGGTFSYGGGYSGGGGGSVDAGSASGGIGGGSSSGAPSGRTGEVEEADISRVDANRLFYLNTYRGFLIYDLADPKNPKQLSRLPIHGYPVEMFVEGHTVYALLRDSLYLTVGPEGLKTTRRKVSQLISIDVSDLANPKVLQTIDIVGVLSEGVSRKVENTIYVVSRLPQSYYWAGYPYGDDRNEQAWVYSFDIADPTRMKLADTLKLFEGGSGYTSDGGSSSSRYFGGVAISATSNTLQVVENWYGYSYSTEPVYNEAGANCGSYRSSQDATVSIVDISNPDGRIRLHSRFSTPGSLTDQFKHTYVYDELTKKGYYLGIFAIRGWSTCDGLPRNTLEAWDVTDGAHPTRVSALEFGHENETVRGTAFDLRRKVAYAITARNSDPLYALDFTDPTKLKVLSAIEGLSGDMSVFRLINDNQFLIGIGRDTAEGCANNGVGGATNWSTQIAVSIIDVRALGAIRLVQRKCVEVKNTDWVTSELTWNLDQAHKMIGLFSDATANVVTVPVTYYAKENADDGWYWYNPKSAVGVMSYDLSRYDPTKSAADQQVLTSRSTVLHPEGSVSRSILFAHESATGTGSMTKRRMMVNLSDTHVSVVDLQNLDAPVPQSVIEVAPYHARVYRFGEYIVDEVQLGGGSWWQPGASEFRIKRANQATDDSAPLAAFRVGRVDRVVQWKNLLLVFRPVGDPNTPYWRTTSVSTEIVAYDLTDPAHPARRGSVTTDFASRPWYGFWCGSGWGWWSSWAYSWQGSADSMAQSNQGVALLTRQYASNGYSERLGFLDVTNADHLRFVTKEMTSHTYRYENSMYVQPKKNVMSLVSSGDSADGFLLTMREVVSTAEHLTTYRYTANHLRASLDIDWSVRTPGTAMRLFESGGARSLLTTDSEYHQRSGFWYGDPRLHMLRLENGRARLTDTLSLPGMSIGDIVGDANRLFVKTSGALDAQDALRIIDVSEGLLAMKSTSPMGSWSAQLMGLVGDRLFVNLQGDGVMIVDVAKLEAPKPVHFVRTLGWATHVVFTATSALVASGSFGLFDIPLDGAPSIARQAGY